VPRDEMLRSNLLVIVCQQMSFLSQIDSSLPIFFLVYRIYK